MSTDLTSTPTHVGREIRRQPAAWSTALERLPDLAGRLPQAGERVAVIGCGTSWFMAGAYAALREGAGQGETDAFAASQFPASRSYDRVVAISRSGTTTEVVRAIESTRSPVVALTAVPGGPVAAAAGETIGLEFADEQSVVQTVFATTVLMLLRGSLGESLLPVIRQAVGVLGGAAPYPAELEAADEITFLGQDWAFGLAQEAALKMREAAQLWTEAYPQMEYRHGPISIAQPGRAVWILGQPVAGIADDIRSTGATLVEDDLDPVVDLVRVQLLAVRRAEARALDPDQPRHLTRAVLLSDRSTAP
jgi:fructoselysine-6-P-deglycase FrlB-like protein